MMPYMILLCVILFFICVQQTNQSFLVNHASQWHKLAAIVLCMCLLALYGFRDHIGFDYGMYVNFVETNTGHFYGDAHGEYFSAWLLDLASELGDYHWFFFFVAIISLPLYVYSMYRYPEVPGSVLWGLLAFLAIPLGFVDTLSIQRQFGAMGILLFGTRYLMKRSFFKYLLCIVAAFMFHVSSLMYLVLYPLTSRRVSLRMVILGGTVFAVLVNIGVKVLADAFPIYAHYLLSSTTEKSSGFTQLFMFLGFAGMFLFFRHWLHRFSFYDVFLKTYLVGLFITLGIFPFESKVAFRGGGQLF